MTAVTIQKHASDIPNDLTGILTKFIEVVHELLGKIRYYTMACGFTSPFSFFTSFSSSRVGLPGLFFCPDNLFTKNKTPPVRGFR